MKFVYYRSLAKCLDVSIEKLEEEQLNQLRTKAENHFESNNSLICEEQTLSMTDVFALIDRLKSPSNVVFHDWINSDKAISNVLQANNEKLNFQEVISNQKYQGHALEKQFYLFLTPFLISSIEKKITTALTENDFDKLRFYLQYSNFIEDSKKTAIQQEVDRLLRSFFSDLNKAVQADDISGFNDHFDKEVSLLASQDLVAVLNLLDKQFYALRVTYIDTIKKIMVQPDIELVKFKSLSRAINSVALNNSHKAQVESFLQQSQTKVNKKQRTTVFNKALLRNPLTYLGFVVIIILVLLIFPFEFKNSEPPKNSKITGLDSLSQDEVKQTDSLLAFKNDSVLFETEDMNVPVVMPDFIISDNTTEIKNETALKLYESMLNDYEIQQTNGGSDCDSLKGESLKAFNYENIDNISGQFSNHEFVNESDQDCYLLIFDNKKDGAAYGAMVPAGRSIELKIVKNWRVIFYTGRAFTKFNPLKTSNNGYGSLEDAKKIDKVFTAHYCKMDYSNFRILSNIYHVAFIGKKTRLVTNSSGALEVQSKSVVATK